MKEIHGIGIEPRPVQVREGNTVADILKEAKDRARIGVDYHRNNFNRAEQNVNIIFGDQYDADELMEREADNRVSLTFNKLPQFINNVTGAQRANVTSIKVTPTGRAIHEDEPTLVSQKNESIKLSRVLSDLIRDIEYESSAISAYKMAFKHSLEGGFGWLRVLTDYQDDGFDLDIKIKGVRDRWSVIPDNTAVEADMSDMNWCFITERMSLDEFKKRWPDKSYEPIVESEEQQTNTFWGDQDNVTVAEYFRREPYKKKIVLLSDGGVYDKDDIEPIAAQLEEMGVVIEKEREIMTHKVIWCKISNSDVLEKEVEFPTTTIPMVPIIGRETDFRGKRMTKGLIDDAIDAQLSLNKMRSSALERIDSAPLSPYLATAEAIQGHEEMWAEANTVKWSTLVYNKGEDKPERMAGSVMPNAELLVTGVLDQDMKDAIGIHNAGLGQTSNEISGKAIKARQAEADVGTYEFLDNYETGIRRVGLLCVEMIPIIYDTERVIRIRGADGTTDTIEINKVVTNEEGEEEVIHTLDFGKHTVVVTTGASYNTKREENADQILEVMKVAPQVAQVSADLLVKNLDFSESDVIAERLTKLMPPNLLSKEKREEIEQDAPPPQPSPEQQKAQAEQEKLKIETDMKKLELESKVELEKIKLEIAQVNLEKAKLELDNKDKADGRDLVQREEVRRDNIAKSIAEKMKGAQGVAPQEEQAYNG